MPVSRIGLVVENVRASATFYAAALQPLGYRYFGTLNDQVGFGVNEADLFLSPSTGDAKPAPIHVGFVASSTSAVRAFYASALTAGGRPTGQPEYRGREHESFNAAVLDPDGNTIEVVYNEVAILPETPRPPRSLVGQPFHRHTITNGYDQQYAQPAPAIRPPRRARRSSPAPVSPKAAPTTASSLTPEPPRSASPPDPKISKSFVKGLLGAAVGAAAIYAAVTGDSDSSRHRDPDGPRSRGSKHGSSRDYKHSSGSDLSAISSELIGMINRRYTDDSRPRPSTTLPRRSTYDGGSTVRPSSGRRDSGVSISSRRSTTTRKYKREVYEAPIFRDTLGSGEKIDWAGDKSYRARQHPQHGPSRTYSSTADDLHMRSRPSPDKAKRYDDLPRASLAQQGRRHTAPAPVPLNVIKSVAGGRDRRSSSKQHDNDTVLPEDSISCATSRQHLPRRSRRYDDGRSKPQWDGKDQDYTRDEENRTSRRVKT